MVFDNQSVESVRQTIFHKFCQAQILNKNCTRFVSTDRARLWVQTYPDHNFDIHHRREAKTFR